MLTLSEIYEFLNRFEGDNPALKDYYDKCYDTLKEVNKRSNLITFLTLIVFALYSFNSYIKEFEVLGFKINKDLVKITSPLLISFFVLEWCLIARRRRELLKLMKHFGFKLFKIRSVNDDFDFNHFSLYSRNAMPFSFMIEFVNIEYHSLINRILLLLVLLVMFLGLPGYTGYLLYVSFTEFKQTLPILICNLTSVYCFVHIILFYKNEIILAIRIFKADNEFKNIVNSINQT